MTVSYHKLKTREIFLQSQLKKGHRWWSSFLMAVIFFLAYQIQMDEIMFLKVSWASNKYFYCRLLILPLSFLVYALLFLFRNYFKTFFVDIFFYQDIKKRTKHKQNINFFLHILSSFTNTVRLENNKAIKG